jgi:hypothetical protein
VTARTRSTTGDASGIGVETALPHGAIIGTNLGRHMDAEQIRTAVQGIGGTPVLKSPGAEEPRC